MTLRSAAALLAAALTVISCGGTQPAPSSPPIQPGRWPSMATPPLSPAKIGSAGVSGVISAPGGPYLVDSKGRVVFLHGVNAVYKFPPYVLFPDPGHPWNFSSHDASLLARSGFNLVRLGMTWKGLEPGLAAANDPAICRHGPPADPGQFDQSHLSAYLANLRQTVDLLGKYHIYTLLDMHQDVYNEMFGGEGAPDWAVCTDGHPAERAPGRWSNGYSTAAADAAFENFWTNDVVGDLQGEFDRVWTDVATEFANDPWIVGYDPFNEPFSQLLLAHGRKIFDAQLLCFYEGSTAAQVSVLGRPDIDCPPGDPAVGLIPRLLQADHHHLVFYEPDIFSTRVGPNFVGPMNFPRLVFNVHDYCSYRSGVTGNPTDVLACGAQFARNVDRRGAERSTFSTAAQPGGPAWFVSEFGATSDAGIASLMTDETDDHLVGWSYWSWRYYDDPTGSADEALVGSDGQLKTTALALSAAYPQAVAGVPDSTNFDPTTGVFTMTYHPIRSARGPTVVFVPVDVHYPGGYCPTVSGGEITSRPGSRFLTVRNGSGGGEVTVGVRPGHC